MIDPFPQPHSSTLVKNTTVLVVHWPHPPHCCSTVRLAHPFWLGPPLQFPPRVEAISISFQVGQGRVGPDAALHTSDRAVGAGSPASPDGSVQSLRCREATGEGRAKRMRDSRSSADFGFLMVAWRLRDASESVSGDELSFHTHAHGGSFLHGLCASAWLMHQEESTKSTGLLNNLALLNRVSISTARFRGSE